MADATRDYETPSTPRPARNAKGLFFVLDAQLFAWSAESSRVEDWIVRWEELFSWCGFMGNRRFKITVLQVRVGAHRQRERGREKRDAAQIYFRQGFLLGAQAVQTIYTFLYSVYDFTMYRKRSSPTYLLDLLYTTAAAI